MVRALPSTPGAPVLWSAGAKTSISYFNETISLPFILRENAYLTRKSPYHSTAALVPALPLVADSFAPTPNPPTIVRAALVPGLLAFALEGAEASPIIRQIDIHTQHVGRKLWLNVDAAHDGRGRATHAAMGLA